MDKAKVLRIRDEVRHETGGAGYYRAEAGVTLALCDALLEALENGACGICGGIPPSSGLLCACGGSNSSRVALAYVLQERAEALVKARDGTSLGDALQDLDAALERERAMRAMLDNLKQAGGGGLLANLNGRVVLAIIAEYAALEGAKETS